MVSFPSHCSLVVRDHLAYQTDGAGTLLASYTYDSAGTPASVQVGSDPTTAPRYWYVYNAHGDVVALVDTTGTPVASYSYDSWGNLTSSSESFTNGWSNPYRYDGAQGHGVAGGANDLRPHPMKMRRRFRHGRR